MQLLRATGSVTLSSGAATTTSSGGYYSFTDVEGGTYTVTISGYPEDASFDATSAEVTIATSGQTVTRNFSGSYIRTASLMGMVTVEGVGLPGVTVDITGRDDLQTTTDANGQYTFTGLRAGNYTVEISGFDPTDVAFSDATGAVTITVGESKVWSFDGAYVRESTIAGQVSVEGNGLSGVTVSLQGMGSDEERMTDNGGQYTFDNLRAGEYQVAISGYDTREYGFETTSATIRVEHGKTANQPFEGIMLRTASIMGQVSVEGEGLPEVTVSLSGEGENQTAMTDMSGQYTFTDLPAGNFQVGISGYDTDDYSFETTSRNVSLALGETATVPFEGILLRTSGISGRVSVEGMGLDSVTVTLSGDDLADDMTAMTDMSGQYAFAGLAEGDYTVAISDFDDVAYVFATTSMDVTLGDDDVQIHNFMGMHARTASVSGMIYVDEAGKNDAYDDGENALAAPGIALALVGPGVNDVMPGITGPNGSFAFANLRSGPYQLVISPVNPAIPPDFAYGGPAEGYSFALAVGQAATQNIPFDITHTTVNFMVNLKSGAAMGDALPGATVSFFRDMAGDQKIGDAMSGDDGMASLRIARMAGSHMVYASVAAPSGSYDTDGAMQAVMWDAKMTMHAASNSSDITNTMADFSFSGATVTTDFGGGMALGGWAISVTSGGDAVEGAPAALGTDGSAKFSETAAAGKTYKITVAANQDNALDGGEKYSAGDGLEYTHTGLSLPATMDAGMLEVAYTTQTLKVYVHNERDQVHGYTGNVLGGDARSSAGLDIGIRHIERATGRSRAFLAADKVKMNLGVAKAGVYVFSNVPADAQVIVTAKAKSGVSAKLLGEDELDAYTDNADNGRMGGAFGDNGGYNHTVELCPLMVDGEGNQPEDECGTFAFVETYTVDGLVWRKSVAKTGDDFTEKDPDFSDVVNVTLTPVKGKNLVNEGQSFNALSKPSKRGATDDHVIDFEDFAAGVYEIAVSDGWRYRTPQNDEGTKGATGMLGDALNPLAGDLSLDVTPTTATVYGRVNGDDGFPLDSVMVTINGQEVETDEHGRYIVDNIAAATRKIGSTTYRNMIFVDASRPGFDDPDTERLSFAANSVTRHDFDIEGSAAFATVSGTVTAFGSTDLVGGVEIRVDGGAPMNKNAKSKGATTNDIYVTSSGNYEIRVTPTSTGATAEITAHKNGYTFTPTSISLSTPEGSSVTGINFQAVANSTIRGRVEHPDGGPFSGVEVTATGDNGSDTDMTSTTGIYSLSVPAGTYTLAFEKEGYSFTEPEGGWDVTVGLGQTATFAQVASTKDPDPPTPPSDDATLSALSLSDGALDPAFSSADTMYTANVGVDTDTITVMATAAHDSADVVFNSTDADTVAAGHQVALAIGDNMIMVTVTAEDGTTTMRYHLTVSRSDGHVAPSAPTSFEVAPGDQQAVLTWGAPRQIGSSAITGYAWEATAPGYLTVGSGGTNLAADATTVTATGLTNGVTYTFSVWAINQKGETGSEVDVAGTKATVMAKAQPFITLTTTGDLEEGDATSSVTAVVALSNASTEDITITVVEKFAEGDTEMRSQVTITNPTIMIPAGNTTPATGTDATTITAVDDVVADEGGVGTAAHTAMVQATSDDAVDSDSDGDAANDVLAPNSITINDATEPDAVPGAPGTLAFRSVGTTAFTVEWASPDNAGTSAITHYQIRWSANAWTTVTGGAAARTHAITGLTTGTTYSVEVRAVSAAGDGTAQTGSQATN